MVKSGHEERATPARPFPCLYIDIYPLFVLSPSEKPPQDAAEDNPFFLPHSSVVLPVFPLICLLLF